MQIISHIESSVGLKIKYLVKCSCCFFPLNANSLVLSFKNDEKND